MALANHVSWNRIFTEVKGENVRIHRVVSYFLKIGSGLLVGSITYKVTYSRIQDPGWLVLLIMMTVAGISDAVIKVLNGEVLAWNYLDFATNFYLSFAGLSHGFFSFIQLKNRW